MTSTPMGEPSTSDNHHDIHALPDTSSSLLRPDVAAAQGTSQPSNASHPAVTSHSPAVSASSSTSSTQTQTPTTAPTQPHANRLLPSPLSPPTSSSHQRPQSRISAVSGVSKDSHDGTATRKSQAYSISSTPRTLASSNRSLTASADNRERQRAVRSLPPWVQSAEDEENVDATSFLLPRTPSTVRHANHNFCPTPKSNVPGRKFDHVREGTPVTLATPVSDTAPKWKQFTQASNLDRPISSRGQIVDDDWLRDNMPDLEQKWEPISEAVANEPIKGFWLFTSEKRKRKLIRFHNTIMNHPMVPAVIRAIVLIFSILALSLASSIYRHSDNFGCTNNSSTWMAILVDIVAILYTVYITYDEYTSKPLGLRSHNAKMSLIFLDLAFIVFESANLSLAFQALTDEKWACVESGSENACPYRTSICERQKGLTATLFIALIAWIATFAISTLRLIHRVASNKADDVSRHRSGASSQQRQPVYSHPLRFPSRMRLRTPSIKSFYS